MSDTGSSAWITFRLARNDEAPARARAQVRRLLNTVPTAVRSDALMLLSEVVTNAVRHGSGSIAVRAEADDAGVEVSVADDAAAEPRLMIQPLDAEGGRGLALVASLSDAWGVRQLPDGKGKAVWFRVGKGPPRMRSGGRARSLSSQRDRRAKGA